MRRATTLIIAAIAFLRNTAAATLPPVTFESPCDVLLTQQSERTEIENKWFALTGRVFGLKVERNGDINIALQDAIGDKPGTVVVEVPANRSGIIR
jgi:hypothetical protein